MKTLWRCSAEFKIESSMIFYMQLPLTPKITTKVRSLQQTDGDDSLRFDILSFSILACLISVFTRCLQNASFRKAYRRHNWHDICLVSGWELCGGLRRAKHEVKSMEFTHWPALPKGSRLVTLLSFPWTCTHSRTVLGDRTTLARSKGMTISKSLVFQQVN